MPFFTIDLTCSCTTNKIESTRTVGMRTFECLVYCFSIKKISYPEFKITGDLVSEMSTDICTMRNYIQTFYVAI